MTNKALQIAVLDAKLTQITNSMHLFLFFTLSDQEDTHGGNSREEDVNDSDDSAGREPGFHGLHHAPSAHFRIAVHSGSNHRPLGHTAGKELHSWTKATKLKASFAKCCNILTETRALVSVQATQLRGSMLEKILFV